MRHKKFSFILALLCAVAQGAWADTGDTEYNPIIISSPSDWDTFATNVNDGTNNYSGKFVRLDADISVSTMVGTSEANSFQGTFFSNGSELVFRKGSPGIGVFNEKYCAPFRYVKNATIRDLDVAGEIYTNKKYSGGLVAYCDGTTIITNCRVRTVIHNVGNDSGACAAGFVGNGNGTLTITGCIYDGRLFTNNTNALYWAGFVLESASNLTISNSLYAPKPEFRAEVGETAVSFETFKSATFDYCYNGQAHTLTNCYYTERLRDSQGLRVYTSAPENEISEQILVCNVTVYSPPSTVTGVEEYYLYTGSDIDVAAPVVTTPNGTVLTAGTDYTYTVSPATVKEKGTYTMIITAKEYSKYVGTKVVKFYVIGDGDNLPVSSLTTNLEAGKTYQVYDNITVQQRLNVNGNVVLNLGEGTTLTAAKGIELSTGNSANLTINGPGALTINDCDDKQSGIGAYDVGALTINGGTINVTGGYMAAGIGGSYNDRDGGTITINGGVVNATGGYCGAGIGGGGYDQAGDYGLCGTININGGQVTAIGGLDGAGVGPGKDTKVSPGAQNNGTLTLGWTKITDFFYNSGFANSLNGRLATITFAANKDFYLDGTTTIATTDNIEGKKIVPAYHSGDYELTDGNAYTTTVHLMTESATYKKTVAEGRTNKHMSWLVPFDYTITAADLLKFNFWKIDMIAHAPNPQTNATDDIWVFLKKLDAGAVLHANMPYVYMAKEAVTDYTFTTDNYPYLQPKNTGVIAKTETMEDIYKFYATYEPTMATAQDPFYYVNIDGELSLGNDGTVTVGAFRWIMRVESKFGNTPSYARKMVFFDGEEEATGVKEVKEVNDYSWYTLDGCKLSGKPTQKGIYVIGGRKVVI